MNRKKQSAPAVTALYCRLSLEDGRENESLSIANQKSMLKDFADKNGLFPYAFYVDDGYTGRNFNRPDFQRMIADIEQGKVHCVVTKDLSRLGRNYIEAGSYIEVFFPKHNIRYIAISDGVDSINRHEMDIAPFKNILNDLYSRDISKKVLAGRMAMSRRGKFCGGPTPLGLRRDPADHGHLIIDPATAPIIKLIYDLAQEGLGVQRIAKYLLEHKIPISRRKTDRASSVNDYAWGGSAINKILRNPVYKGDHVVCRTHQKAIRSNTYHRIPREEWEIVENAHEAIISKVQWEKVQQLIDRRPVAMMKGEACPFYNLFHGLLYCETCGKSMQVRYEKIGRTNVDRFTKKQREPIDRAYYTCQTYNRLGKDSCTSHKIEARDLYDLVLGDIRALSETALADKEGFYDRLAHSMERQYTVDWRTMQNEMEAITSRNAEIDRLIMSLYADKSRGVLTEHRFLIMTETLEQEQEENRQRLQAISDKLAEAQHSENDIQLFIHELRQYAAITELTEGILNRLIDRIYIGPVENVDGEKVQTVRIIYNFVGAINE